MELWDDQWFPFSIGGEFLGEKTPFIFKEIYTLED